MEATESQQPPVREGEVLAGKYRVERVLGAGAMGVVVSALHVHLGERVALKFLHPEMVQNQEVVARFLREAQSAVRIKGEHVCRVSDVGTLENGAPYMVMEYLTGSDLAAVLETQKRLDVPAAVDFIIQACDALAEAHALGIVHRDLKPSNLFLTKRPDGSPLVKVLDFGVAKIIGDQPNVPKLTAAGAILGSPLYMSPEQLLGSKAIDGRSDIWQLGIILYELLTGQPPFDGNTLTEIVVAIGTQPAPALRRLRPDTPVELETTIYRCLEKDANKRLPDVAALAEALLPFATTRRAQVAVENIVSMQRGAAAVAHLPPMRERMVSGHMLIGGGAEGAGANVGGRGVAGPSGGAGWIAETMASTPAIVVAGVPASTAGRPLASSAREANESRERAAETLPSATGPTTAHGSEPRVAEPKPSPGGALKWALLGGGIAAVGTVATVAALQFFAPRAASTTPKAAAQDGGALLGPKSAAGDAP